MNKELSERDLADAVAKERERCALVCEEANAKGHRAVTLCMEAEDRERRLATALLRAEKERDILVGILTHLRAQILERDLADAVAKERERCAKVCEEYPGDLHTRQDQWLANEIAAEIRKEESVLKI